MSLTFRLVAGGAIATIGVVGMVITRGQEGSGLLIAGLQIISGYSGPASAGYSPPAAAPPCYVMEFRPV